MLLCLVPTQSESELASSRELLQDWLVSLPKATGVPLERTVLMGFSQGGAMALDIGCQLPVARLVILSGYLHSPPASNTAHLPPILIIHGNQDTVVPLTSASFARSTLEARGASVSYHEFDMGHEIRPQVLPIVRDFIEAVG
jgi:phospholipase/carboxylesterase